MAQSAAGAPVDFNFTNATRTPGSNAAHLTTPVNYTSVSALKAALKGYDSVTYSDKELDSMTTNDMVFALRNIQDPKTIADYVAAQVSRSA